MDLLHITIQDSKNKNINNVKVSSVTKATVESNTLPTIPHTGSEKKN